MSKSRTRKQQVDRLSVGKQLPGASRRSPTSASTGQDSPQHMLHALGNEQVQRLVKPEPAINSEGKIAPEVETSIRSAQGGQALDAVTRNSMETAFGADFGGVRLHTDEQSEQLNHSLQARSFTTGDHIFFSRGAYDPASMAGRELLAHELTHVVQQGGGRGGRQVQAQLKVSRPGDRQEQEAERVARAVVNHKNIEADARSSFDGKQINRKPEKKKEHTPETKVADTVTLWEGATDQKKFLEQALAAHLDNRSRVGVAQPDLAKEDLANVEGTSILMQKDAAAAAGKLLAAANQALALAQEAGNADALKTKRIAANSGHRNQQYQRDLWVNYFPDYYNRTAKKRAKLEGGPHGDVAVKYMVQFINPKIAAPGFSNHQAGLAIDFGQVRSKGQEISNKTNSSSIEAWRATWFFAWLQTNARGFGFAEYDKEPWHWVYQPATDHPVEMESQHHD